MIQGKIAEMYIMSKQNQYDSERNYTSDNDYYRDQTNHETDRVYYDQPSVDEARAEWNDNPASRVADATHEANLSGRDQLHREGAHGDTYFEPYNVANGDAWTDHTQQPNDAYFAHDSERGFNQLFDSALSEDGRSSEVYFDDYAYDEQNTSPHDEQNIVDALTGQKKASGIRVYADDFVDRPQKPGGIQIPKPAVFVIAAFVLAGLGAALFHMSKPDMSAYDIVQMESYDGIQQVPAIFNLTNLDECSSQSDCIKASLNASRADIAEYTETTSAIREIPAANTAAAGVPRQITFDTADTVTTQTSSPDQLQVKAQWSNVRMAPNMSGTIVTSLAKGTLVSVISSRGSWYEIQALNDQQQRGFMHRSTVESVSH